MMIISNSIAIPDNEIKIKAIRSQGAGGQNVNKVATAIQLRFDINSSSLPEDVKERLLFLRDRRITSDGVIVLKAQKYRTQDKNREDAFKRLTELIKKCLVIRKKRKPTKPNAVAMKKRLDSKVKRGRLKALRGKVEE